MLLFHMEVLSMPNSKLYRERVRTVAKGGLPTAPSIRTGQMFLSTSQNGPWKLPSEYGLNGLWPVNHVTNSPFVEQEKTKDYTNPGPPFVSAGPFFHSMERYSDFDVQHRGTYFSRVQNSSGYWEKYVGGFALTQGYAASTVMESLSAWRPLAFNKLKPSLSAGGLGVAVAELRDVPRMLKTTSKGFHDIWKELGGNQKGPRMLHKEASNHYLNHQFGWVPFLSDLAKSFYLYKNSAIYVHNLSDRNNQWSKRRRTLYKSDPIETLIAQGAGTSVYPIHPDPRNFLASTDNSSGNWNARRVKSRRVWATGHFKFYRPEFDRSLPTYNSNWNKVQQNLILQGLRINPTMIWKATPWTWLADWFGNVGDVIDNATSAGQDALVSKDLCLMQHQTEEVRINATLTFKTGGARTFNWSNSFVTKQRDVAVNPYGFGLSQTSLSLKQLSILGALGISRYS